MNDKTKWAAAGLSAAGALAAVAFARRRAYSFRDKAVFITGGSRGLGFMMARLLAEEGARLTLVSRTREQLHDAEDKLSDTGAEISTMICDVRDKEQVRETIEASVRHYGSIDVLINNAGVIQVGPF